VERDVHVLPLSARSPAALRALASRLAKHLRLHPEQPLGDIGHTMAIGRSHFEERLAVVASDPAGAGEELRAFLAGELRAGVISGTVSPAGGPGIAMVFTGSSGGGMGRRLYQTQPVFREALDRCVDLWMPHLPGALRERISS